MRTSVRSLATAVVLAACPFAAQATNPAGWFIQANAGFSNSSHDDGHYPGSRHPDSNDHAYGGLIGYRWGLTETYALGVEAGYTRLGESKSDNINSVPFPISFPGFPSTCAEGSSWSLRTRAAVLGAAMKWDVSGPWTITAHAGAARTHATHDEDVAYCTLSRGRHTTTAHDGAYTGLGFGYDLTPAFTLALNADMYWVRFDDGFVSRSHTTRIRVLGASAEYRF